MRLLRKTGVRQPWQPAPLASEWLITPPRLLVDQADPPLSIYSGRTIWVGWRGQYPISVARPLTLQVPTFLPPAARAQWLLVPREAPAPPVDPIPRGLALSMPSMPLPSATYWQPAPPRPVLAERVPAPNPIVISASGLPTAGAITLWSIAPREQPATPAERLSPLMVVEAQTPQPPAATAWIPQPIRQERTDRLARTQVLRAPAAQPPGAVVWQPTPFRQLPELRTGGLQLLVVGVPVPIIGASVVWAFAWRESQAGPSVPRHLHLSPRSQALSLDARSTELTLSPRSRTLTLTEDRE